MKNTKKLTLMEGSFTYDEAREILLKMFSFKINFHHIKNWSAQERFGKDDETAQKRIPQLKNEMEKLQSILLMAKEKEMHLDVKAEIDIRLTHVIPV
ncbi:MAG: hypothetical protein JST81_02000 [Bacteroidetes bacterium]|nr:hypothetical protein [Bacteroidota bacterium]